LALRWRSTSHKVHDRTLENTRALAKPTPPHEEQENLDARRVVCGGGVAHANFAPPSTGTTSVTGVVVVSSSSAFGQRGGRTFVVNMKWVYIVAKII